MSNPSQFDDSIDFNLSDFTVWDLNTKRAQTNRENAQHSTGPRSPEGKARAAQNSTKHGMYAKQALLPTEDPAEYDALRKQIAQHWQAETPEELNLVQTVLDARWRLRRVLGRETALTVLTKEQNLPECEDLYGLRPETRDLVDSLAEALGFQKNLRAFGQLQRYESKLMRIEQDALKQLREMTAARQKDPAPQPEKAMAAAAAIAADPITEPTPEPAIAAVTRASAGFVPTRPPTVAYPANMPRFSGPHKKEHRRNWLRKHGQTEALKLA